MRESSKYLDEYFVDYIHLSLRRRKVTTMMTGRDLMRRFMETMTLPLIQSGI